MIVLKDMMNAAFAVATTPVVLIVPVYPMAKLKKMNVEYVMVLVQT